MCRHGNADRQWRATKVFWEQLEGESAGALSDEDDERGRGRRRKCVCAGDANEGDQRCRAAKLSPSKKGR